MPRPEIFSKNHSRENTPRVMGPGTNILYMADWRGLTAGDLSISLPPWVFPWTPPFAGRGGAVSGPQRRRFILPGGRSWGAFRGAGAPGGAGWPGEGRRHPEPISFRLLLLVSALFARVPIYERYGKISGRAYSGKLYVIKSVFSIDCGWLGTTFLSHHFLLSSGF